MEPTALWGHNQSIQKQLRGQKQAAFITGCKDQAKSTFQPDHRSCMTAVPVDLYLLTLIQGHMGSHCCCGGQTAEPAQVCPLQSVSQKGNRLTKWEGVILDVHGSGCSESPVNFLHRLQQLISSWQHLHGLDGPEMVLLESSVYKMSSSVDLTHEDQFICHRVKHLT